MYQDDSFFSLGTGGATGLVAVSTILAVAVFWAAARVMRGRGIAARLIVSAVFFVTFVWLSPQIYYAYYFFLFEDLPVQWVARVPTVAGLFEMVTFTGRSNLSAHSKGVLFWLLVILAAKPRGLRP